ncbi:MAG: EamA family transporter [Rhizobiaceae bacterium]|nr:EamA family transporter [Rhizobiaceae bacterium]
MFGIGLMLVAYLTFSFIDAGVKWLAIAGLPALQLAFMRYAAHFLISLAIILRGGFSKQSFTSERPVLVLVRGSLIMMSTVFNFFAVRYLPLTLTSTILFSAPLIVCALSWPLLGERVGPWRWFAIIVGFCGIIIAVRPFDDEFHWAVIISLMAAISFAMYLILTRKLAGKVSTDTMQFYSGAVGFVVLAPFAVFTWQNPTNLLDWLVLCGLGLAGWAGHQLLTNAYRFAPASILSPFAYSFILYLTAWSFLLFNHLPDRWTIIGAVFIVAAGLIIWLRERALAKRPRLSHP